MEILIYILSGYILSILIARQLTYYAYIREYYNFFNYTKGPMVWYFPLINIIYSIFVIIEILKNKFGKINVFNKFHGSNWEDKRQKYLDKKNKKIYEKMKDIDPYKEEDWNDK